MTRLGERARRRAFVEVPPDFFEMTEADRDRAVQAMAADMQQQLGIEPAPPPSSRSRRRRRGRQAPS